MEIQNKRHFTLTNIMFLTMALVFISTSVILGRLKTPLKLYFLITQYGVILVPSLIFLKLTGHKLKSALRLKAVPVKILAMSLLITLISLPIAYTLNMLMTFVLSKFDALTMNNIEMGSGSLNYLIFIFLMSVTPGICEEVFFRGMILSGYEKIFSPKKTIIFTGLLFGLFHFELQNFMLPAFLGMVFAWLVINTDSIYTSILGHAVFNAIGVTLNFFSPKVTLSDFQSSANAMKNNETEVVLLLLFMVLISLVSLNFLRLAMKALKSMCYCPQVGDVLKVQSHAFEILELSSEDFTVEKEGEFKRIKRKKLKDLEHSFIKKTEEKPVYYKPSAVNYLLIIAVIILFIGLNTLSRI